MAQPFAGHDLRPFARFRLGERLLSALSSASFASLQRPNPHRARPAFTPESKVIDFGFMDVEKIRELLHAAPF